MKISCESGPATRRGTKSSGGAKGLKHIGRVLAVAAALLAALPLGGALAGEGFTIEIDGVAYEIGLDTPTEVVLQDGRRLQVVLSQDEYTTYKTEAYSFSHKSHYKPSRSDVGDGIFQTAIITPLGTGILVQEYSTLNPSPLVDLVLSELTKEEVDYGYTYQDRDVSKTVGDKTIKGREAITEYGDEKWTRTVYAYGTRDSGLLIVTFVQDAYREKDGELIDDFWNTFEIN